MPPVLLLPEEPEFLATNHSLSSSASVTASAVNDISHQTPSSLIAVTHQQEAVVNGRRRITPATVVQSESLVQGKRRIAPIALGQTSLCAQ